MKRRRRIIIIIIIIIIRYTSQPAYPREGEVRVNGTTSTSTSTTVHKPPWGRYNKSVYA
jgi:hypothetical protein